MSLPATIRINLAAPFPAQVKAAGPVTLSKQNGVWTASFNILGLGALADGTDPTTVVVVVQSLATNTFYQATLAQVLAAASNSPTKISSANSPYPVKLTDNLIYVDTSTGPVEIDLAAANTRGGSPLTIKDITGNAAVNNVTIKPNGLETIDGYTNAAPLKINANYGGFELSRYTGVAPNVYTILP